MKDLKRTLFIGFVWGCIFLWWFVNGFLNANWNFSIFRVNDWLFIVDEFRKGWNISERSDWVFFGILFSMLPLYFIGWRFWLKIDWLALLRKNVNRLIYFLTGSDKPIKKKKNVQLKKNSSKSVRPRAMDSGLLRPVVKDSELKVPVNGLETAGAGNSFSSSGFGMQNRSSMGGGFGQGSQGMGGNSFGMGGSPFGTSGNPFGASSPSNFSVPSDSPFGNSFANPSMQQGFSIAPSPTAPKDDFDDLLLDDIKLPDRTKLEEDIPALFLAAGYKLMQDVQIEGESVNYIAVGSNRVIVCIEDNETGDWLADEERFNGEDPLWFSESSHRVSPIFRLLMQIKSFKERLFSAGFTGSVVPMFIEKSGMIINAEDMLNTWKELDVLVCRTDIGGPDELKSVKETIMSDEVPSEDVITMVHNAL